MAAQQNPYSCGGVGFKIGDLSQKVQRLPFKGTQGYALDFLFFFPRGTVPSLVKSKLTGQISLIEAGKALWKYDFAASRTWECTDRLRDDLAEKYQAFVFISPGMLDKQRFGIYVKRGHYYEIEVTVSDILPRGTALYLYRMPWHTLIFP